MAAPGELDRALGDVDADAARAAERGEQVAEAAADLEDAAAGEDQAPDEALDLLGVVAVLLDPARSPLGDRVVDGDAGAAPLELSALELGELRLVDVRGASVLLRALHADSS